MRIFITIIFTSVTLISQAAEVMKPNIIVIMADDLGYGDIGCYGAKPKNLKTPNIDKLAANGLRFTSGYCSASTCTPTRFSFLTGKYAFRQKNTGIAPPNGPAIIQPGVVTLPSLMKKAGYATAVIGKWHLGLGGTNGPDWNGELKPGPLDIGFDYCYLLPTTNDRVPQVYVENSHVKNLDPNDPIWVGRKKPNQNHPTGITHRSSLKMDWSHGHNSTIHNGISRIGFYTGGKSARFRDEDLADEWVKQSNKWIKANKDNPFFLFFSSHDLHVPRIPHERFRGSSALSYRGDVIVQLDWCVGELVKTLDHLQLSDNTMIVFCSDNGPVGDDGYKDEALEKMADHDPNGPFTGGKYSILEGGTRTPFITYWPGKIKRGISDKIVCTIDMAASFAALTGTKLPKAACPDSFNVIDALLGNEGAKGRKNLVQQDNGKGGNYGYRAGKWKLQRHDSKRKRNVIVTKKLANSPATRFALFDLEKDIEEKNDVSKKHPKVFARMKQELQQIIDTEKSRP
jgi:arylsulfatase A-like enzyme